MENEVEKGAEFGKIMSNILQKGVKKGSKRKF